MSEFAGLCGVHQFPHIVGSEGETATPEFGSVKRLKEIVVEVRVLLGKDKGLVGFAFAVNITEIGFAVEPVVALACKNEPSAVAAPRVVSVGAVAVYYRQRVNGHGL